MLMATNFVHSNMAVCHKLLLTGCGYRAAKQGLTGIFHGPQLMPNITVTTATSTVRSLFSMSGSMIWVSTKHDKDNMLGLALGPHMAPRPKWRWHDPRWQQMMERMDLAKVNRLDHITRLSEASTMIRLELLLRTVFGSEFLCGVCTCCNNLQLFGNQCQTNLYTAHLFFCVVAKCFLFLNCNDPKKKRQNTIKLSKNLPKRAHNHFCISNDLDCLCVWV